MQSAQPAKYIKACFLIKCYLYFAAGEMLQMVWYEIWTKYVEDLQYIIENMPGFTEHSQ